MRADRTSASIEATSCFRFWRSGRTSRASSGDRPPGSLAAIACVALVVGVALADKVSAKSLASTASSLLQPPDQVVLIDQYPYDLPFYLQARKPAWVVSDWQDPEIARRDNWRKELADAGEFDHASRQAVLLRPAEFAARLCSSAAGVLWIWGKPSAPEWLGWLQQQPVFAADQRHALWRLQPAALRKLCGEKPSND